ncbi:GNAT family N-acetyltransferase [Glutamicibacter sp.]|uniref:GNAT family N-acetyltransferase n=1 Tax=Glutamicibacter sp. TaxID=1931995 RepID=UPI0028BDC9CA|nr:GNAT family N-acetyltransferase [Glutamicibacter sp.]
MEPIQLRKPTADVHASWLENLKEWGTADQDGASVFFAEKFDWDLSQPEDFSRWVQLLNDLANPQFQPPAGFVSQTTLWVCRGNEYLGAVSLRHELINEYLKVVGGHIGYGIRPSARGRGLAKIALAGVLEEARRLGLSKVLITCNDSNIASYKTIESGGGILEQVIDQSEIEETFGAQDAVRRYWIEHEPGV